MTAEGPPPLRHLAVILDGNRRWAASRGLPPLAGYRAGAAKVEEFLPWCEEANIEVITLMAASADNLAHRDADVLAEALDLVVTTLEKLAATGHYRIKPMGRMASLGTSVEHALREIGTRTAQNKGPNLNIAIGYSGRDEIIDAVKALLSQGTLESLVTDLRPEDIAAHLYTSGQPDPDLVLRTSGEQRLSTLMPWQTVYSELCFTNAYWPDLTCADLLRAVNDYSHRHRRFGA